MEQQNITKCIEENTERMDLLQKNLQLEQRQKQRLLEISFQKKKDLEAAKVMQLGDGIITTIDKEESQTKESVPPGKKNKLHYLILIKENNVNIHLLGMVKMRKNLENTNSICQETYKEVLEVKTHLAKMESNLETISSHVAKATFQACMQGADISEFFPVENTQKLEAFMDRDHPEWPSRKMEFYNFLFTIASDVKRGFARGLIKALFTREYIVGVKWPSFG